MNNIKQYIQEKLILNKTIKHINYTCHPNNWEELREILEERLAKDKNANLNDIDVSHITSMYNYKKNKSLFKGLDPHNIDISEWNVSNVEDMSCMFNGCYKFNCDLSNWDVSNVEDMYYMFDYCKSLTNKPNWYK